MKKKRKKKKREREREWEQKVDRAREEGATKGLGQISQIQEGKYPKRRGVHTARQRKNDQIRGTKPGGFNCRGRSGLS